MADIETLAYFAQAIAVLHDRTNILPALDIPLAATSLNRCIKEVAVLAEQDAKAGVISGEKLPHDWNKVVAAMRKAEKEIREAMYGET